MYERPGQGIAGAAHGRVNLIGEHTDYNGGLVLPTLIPQRIIVRVRPRDGRAITLSTAAPEMTMVATSLDDLQARGGWSDHVLGVVNALINRGHVVGGFDGEVQSDIPIGAGLASSAALAVATVRALHDAFGLSTDAMETWRVAHESEYSFVGARVGRMDQIACSLGKLGEALFIDTRNVRTLPVAFAHLDLEIAIIDSGIPHDHATGRYNERRGECEEAEKLLGVAALRDVAPDADLSALPPKLQKRVRHVLSENARVVAAVEAIGKGSIKTLGQIINQGHASLRDDYEVSVPAVDNIVAAAQQDADVHGARMTGGGFGGSVLMLAKKGTAYAAARRVVKSVGGKAKVIVPPTPTD